jgi:hypothetical protein
VPTTSVSTRATCAGYADYAGASYCTTTIGAILAGQQPVGSRVVVPDAWVLDSTPRSVVVGRNECPAGSYCGDMLVTDAVTVPAGLESPPVDATIDVYGIVTTQNTITADGFGSH